MAGNTFGEYLKLTTWGESHGEEIGAVIDGVPPMIPINEKTIQKELDRRKPGQSKYVSQRKEDDRVIILSGVFEGYSTGTPIALKIKNIDKKSKDYSDIEDKFRPAHADYTYWKKYGIRDYRGGGRSSARETAMRVAAGSIARSILGEKVNIRGAVVQIGNIKINRKNWDWSFINKNPLFCPDKEAIIKWREYLSSIRKKGTSCGARIEISAQGVPVGLGEPVYGKLDADIASGLMSINAVKGVEIGAGFKVVNMEGHKNADEITIDKEGNTKFLSNYAGGILGGISSGQEIISSIAVKPTSSILIPKKTITKSNKNTSILTKGRHDPCVGIRAVPIAEAMIAFTLADHLLRDRAQNKKDRFNND